MRHFNLTVIFIAVLLGARPTSQTPLTTPSTLAVFVRGTSVGTEDVAVNRSADGWTIVMSGRLGPPFNIITRRLEIKYDADWNPRELTLDAAIGGQPQRLHTTFQGTSASSEISQGGQTRTKTDTVARDTMILPTPFYGAYEAMTAKLRDKTTAPLDLKAYLAPQGEFPIRVTAIGEQRIQLAGRSMLARRIEMTIGSEGSAFPAEVWADENGRLLRLQVPSQGLDVLRQDIAAVSTRIERISRPGDEPVSIPANGFSLAGTVSRPAQASATRLPAIVLVGGSVSADRDETIAGIPVFGQLAGGLADQGFLVVRYDKRGLGQSGGRLESTTITDYADDVRAVAKYVLNRKDVDDKRIAVIGHGEGGTVALVAAQKQDQIRALVLLNTSSIRGAELVLEQQKHVLELSTMSQAEKDTAIDLQQKIIQAVFDGSGWEGIPPDVRRRVDTPFYRSFLLIDPAEIITRVSQPILAVQGGLDKQVLPYHGDHLLELAHARKGKNRIADLSKIDNINHLLVSATSGEVAEYDELKDPVVSPDVTQAISAWLQKVIPGSGR